MAQLHYEAYHAPQHSGTPHAIGEAPPRVGRLVNLVGALVSVALVAGVGIWSYRLMVRDVSGVPVIQALAGPYRTTPDDPGGLQASYQGLAVNNVAAEGNAADTAQVIALAPPPVSLSAEDRAVAALVAGSTRPIAAPPPASIAAAPQPVAPVAATTEQLALVPASRGGVARSPLPRARPGGVTRLAARQPVVAAPTAPAGADPQAEALLQELVTRLAPSQVIDIDPATLAPGTRLVQLGAYESDADARDAWDTLTQRFPAYLENRGRIVEAATAGGRTFYRLRAHGFTDEPEARRFCSIFLADNADCIPVLIR